MPALLPPSMQIGALPNGTAPFQVAGPGPGLMAPAGAYPTFLQAAGAVTSASGPTNITQAVSSTRAGSMLVWAVAVNASAAAALGGTPTGWTLLQSQAVATLALGLYVFPRNPGAITSVTFSSNATATTGGIAAWFWELGNAPFGTSAGASANGSSTAPASGTQTPQQSDALALGAIGWVLGTATLSATPAGYTVNAQQSSTAGTTNAALQTISFLVPQGSVAAQNATGTLSVSSVWGAALVVIPTTAGGATLGTEPGGSFQGDQLSGQAVSTLGYNGWGVGFSKPGGAGGGQ